MATAEAVLAHSLQLLSQELAQSRGVLAQFAQASGGPHPLDQPAHWIGLQPSSTKPLPGSPAYTGRFGACIQTHAWWKMISGPCAGRRR